jgi:hypothetical protein
LKQARHRASRRFLNDGARSSLPQYRQTNLSALEAARDERGGFVFFEARAAFGLPLAAGLFVGATDLPL